MTLLEHANCHRETARTARIWRSTANELDATDKYKEGMRDGILLVVHDLEEAMKRHETLPLLESCDAVSPVDTSEVEARR